MAHSMRKHLKRHVGFGPKRTQEYYEKRFEQFGDTPEAFWGSKEAQEIRFAVLSQIGHLTGEDIFDVGCGSGDLLAYFIDNKIKPSSYRGCDFSRPAIERALMKFPSEAYDVNLDHESQLAKYALFFRHSFEDHAATLCSGSFDYVFASGFFALERPEWEFFMIEAVQEMFRLCRKGVAVNFLSTFSVSVLTDTQCNESHYSSPSLILDLIMRKVTMYATLRHDYRANDYTIYMYRDKQ